MATNHQIVVTDVLQYGWFRETRQSWIELKIDDNNTLQLTFPDEFPPTLKLGLQVLQGHVAEERQKAGLPIIEHTYMQAVQHHEFHQDMINEVALIRTRFQNGASQDTPIEKHQIPQVVEFLSRALQAFEKLSKSPKQ